MGEILEEVMADEEFVVERVLDKRIGRNGKVIMSILVKEQLDLNCLLSG